MDLWTGKYIIEVSGKRRIKNGQGTIGFLSFGTVELTDMNIKSGVMKPGVDAYLSCGERIGAGFDATPPARLFGPCVLTGIEGTGTTFLQSLTFIWSCMGVPDYFY